MTRAAGFVRGASAFVAPTATVRGDVRLGAWSSIWFRAVVRAHAGSVDVGERSNVQDGAVLVGIGQATVIGADVTIGHRAMLIGCRVGDHCLIGNASTVLSGAVLPPWTFVTVGSCVGPELRIPEGSLVTGRPARVLRPIADRERALMASAPAHYVQLLQAYRGSGTRPLVGTGSST